MTNGTQTTENRDKRSVPLSRAHGAKAPCPSVPWDNAWDTIIGTRDMDNPLPLRSGGVPIPVTGTLLNSGDQPMTDWSDLRCPPCNGNCAQGRKCPQREQRPVAGIQLWLASVAGALLGCLAVVLWRAVA